MFLSIIDMKNLQLSMRRVGWMMDSDGSDEGEAKGSPVVVVVDEKLARKGSQKRS
jgi:hypothetical protein